MSKMGTGTGTEKRKGGRPKGSKSSYNVSEKALAQRRDASEKHQADIKTYKDIEGMEYNARQIDHILAISEIASHADRKDVLSMRSCFLNYLRLCQQDGFRVGNLAAYASMGIDLHTAVLWEKGKDEERKKLIRYVRQVCGLCREGAIADQKINPVIGIFWQRNFDGLRNDTEQQAITQEMTQLDNDTMTGDDYKRKYGDLIDD